MSLQRTCYLCGRPVSIRRRMSLFCSDRCESRHRFVSSAPTPRPSREDADGPRLPEGPLGGPARGSLRAPLRY